MFWPSVRVLHAIEAVLDIAYHGKGMLVQSKEVARRAGIPRRYLEPTLQELVRCGILLAVRGPRGGYRLRRERRHITIGEVFRIISDAVHRDTDLKISSSEISQKFIRPLWVREYEEFLKRLDSISIDDLYLEAGQSVPRERTESPALAI